MHKGIMPLCGVHPAQETNQSSFPISCSKTILRKYNGVLRHFQNRLLQSAKIESEYCRKIEREAKRQAKRQGCNWLIYETRRLLCR